MERGEGEGERREKGGGVGGKERNVFRLIPTPWLSLKNL